MIKIRNMSSTRFRYVVRSKSVRHRLTRPLNARKTYTRRVWKVIYSFRGTRSSNSTSCLTVSMYDRTDRHLIRRLAACLVCITYGFRATVSRCHPPTHYGVLHQSLAARLSKKRVCLKISQNFLALCGSYVVWRSCVHHVTPARVLLCIHSVHLVHHTRTMPILHWRIYANEISL